MPATHRRRIAAVDTSRCTGCGWCVPTCDLHLLWLDSRQGKKSSMLHDPAACTGCCRCARRCPFGAITMRPGPAAAAPPESPDGAAAFLP